ncbi:MAG: 8-amino-7-oxononanoate synthase [Actinomycetota bacterium]|nr:8-amino-7-oxononanoate synthase [Actinomycetota bacterium]
MTWQVWLEGALAAIKTDDQWRSLRSFDARGPEGTFGDPPRPVVSFASNDYLGLSCHPAVIAAGHRALDRWGSGSSASRLVVGTRPVHEQLEARLAAWKKSEAALVFPSGYAANLGVLATLAGPDVTVYSDERNHASIVDGCRLSRARVVVYRHRDAGQVADLLRHQTGRALVVTESVFSMDGDVAPIATLVDTCRRAGAMLVVDEAHRVFGPDLDPATGDLDLIRVGTLSKAIGSLGGFVAAPRRWIQLLVNRARPFIFTTAPTPADMGAALAAVDILDSPEGAALEACLRARVGVLRPGHPSPILPVIVGSEGRALEASARLLDAGLLVPAIRPPTVAAGTSRLRIALSAVHTDDHVRRLATALDDLGLGLGVGA